MCNAVNASQIQNIQYAKKNSFAMTIPRARQHDTYQSHIGIILFLPGNVNKKLNTQRNQKYFNACAHRARTHTST